ncbi:MAG TPA: phosphotransferase family protein [Xanthomonadaceae bacterium]|nr:phosphotransferase family protein [Xanthomonadaceae bacterium]
MELTDQARDVRDEDRLDVEQLDAFLKQRIDGLHGTPTIKQFPGGASNLTYLIACGERELVLRRPPTGVKAKSAHDMLREAHVMAALKPHYPLVPTILATCDDHAVLGCDFYVMERLRGIILRRDLPDSLGLGTDGVRTLCLAFIDKLVQLHQVDATLPDLAGIGKGEGYVARQVRGWSDRWRAALTDGTDACEDVLAWLADKQPARETAICVIHNDYRFDNVVLDAGHPLDIVGVLDWEMSTLGDPLMDLGGSLAYWVQADDDVVFQSFRRQPSHVDGMLTRREVVDYYGERTGWSVDNFDFYEVFGLFRLMVIIQQIYRRFVLGQTTNPQFAGFGQAAAYMGSRCRRLITKSRIR